MSRENLQESEVLLDNFFHGQKRDLTSLVTQSKCFECFSSFLKYLSSSICKFLFFFSTILYALLSLSNYYSIFKLEANEN